MFCSCRSASSQDNAPPLAPNQVDFYHYDRNRVEYSYYVKYTDQEPNLTSWTDPGWNGAETGVVGTFFYSREWHTVFTPETKFRMLYDDRGIYVIFRVHDRYFTTRAVSQGPGINDDGAVELFLQVSPDKRYFNFEQNPAGEIWASYVRDIGSGDVSKFMPEEVGRMKLSSSIRNEKFEVSPSGPRSYNVGCFIPFSVLEKYSGVPIHPEELNRLSWRFNVFKCSYIPENPHFGAWAPTGNQPLFHYPDGFGFMYFRPKGSQ